MTSTLRHRQIKKMCDAAFVSKKGGPPQMPKSLVPKMRRSLAGQCVEIGVPFSRIELTRGEAGWEVAGTPYPRPEHAVAALMRTNGWTCATCEGGPMLLLMKAACLQRLMDLNEFGAADSLRRFLEAQFVINARDIDSIIRAIATTSIDQVCANFEAIYAAGVDEYYPGVSVDLIRQLHGALGPMLPRIATRFATDPYAFRAGWPDITAVRDGTILLREVKTSDKLHASQQRTIGGLLIPEGMSVDVLQLVASKMAAPTPR